MNIYKVIASDKDGVWGSYKVQAKSKDLAIKKVKRKLIYLVKNSGTNFDFLTESFEANIIYGKVNKEELLCLDHKKSYDKEVIESHNIKERIEKTEKFIKNLIKGVTAQDYLNLTLFENQLFIMKVLAGSVKDNKEQLSKLEDKDSYPAKVTKEHAKECAKLSRIK